MVLIHKHEVVPVVLGALLLVWWLFYPTERDQLDIEAKRLCAIDGGVKVYEMAILSPEKFNQYGQPLIPMREDSKDFGYFYRNQERHIKGSIDPFNGPSLTQHISQVVRSTDEKVMGQLTWYGRSGGCLLYGVVQGCGFQCSYENGWDFVNKVLLKGEVK
jgi:hypothetical protein